MDDQGYQQEVDTLLKSILEAHSAFQRSYQELTTAADEFVAAVERDPNSSRRAGQSFDKANRAAQDHWRTVADNLTELRNLLRRWKSPGRDFARHAEEVWEVTQDLQTTYNRVLTPKIEQLLNEVNAIRATAP
jgi:hypothetical protein